MNVSEDTTQTKEELTFEEFKQEVLNDYKLANISRECSLLGRREVLTGKAKFGIFGDGKEVAQIAMAKFFEKGDWRSGYYRDQTFMMAIGELTPEQFFAGLYAHTDLEKEPMSGGRQMGGHYSTHTLTPDGSWKNITEQKNSSADISPTSGQMPRLLGLALASKVYKENELLHNKTQFSRKGREIAFGTIGDASTSEGHFWETMNAASVMQVPMLVSVWDDGHGISVPKKYQTTKESISEALKGFEKDGKHPSGIKIFKTKGWNYPHLIETYKEAVDFCRNTHTPVLIHVEEVTQPQGHSTSGSHERYKSPERLQWEKDFDPIKKMGEWMVANNIATQEELEAIQKEAKKIVREAKNKAWNDYLAPIKKEHQTFINLCTAIAEKSQNKAFILST
ncbi:MAG: thiamine pyrophosphate-dependent dehydrogenase E1 component subunit alpha, partial [Bacteroidetes bacterium]